MSDLDAQTSEPRLRTGQYLRKYALLYSKCAKGLDSNVSPEEMNKELIRMAGYDLNDFLTNSKLFCFRCKTNRIFIIEPVN